MVFMKGLMYVFAVGFFVVLFSSVAFGFNLISTTILAVVGLVGFFLVMWVHNNEFGK